jgi:hypothetical protein
MVWRWPWIVNTKITFGLPRCVSRRHNDNRTRNAVEAQTRGGRKKGGKGKVGRERVGGGEGEKSERAEKMVLVSIRRKLSEISRLEFDITGLCIRFPMRDLTFTDSVHHFGRSARGPIPHWPLAKIQIYGSNPDG